jgi:hypothetical protein
MYQKEVNQLAQEMTDLCTNRAQSVAPSADSPAVKAFTLMVQSVLLENDPEPDLRLWWKPPVG